MCKKDPAPLGTATPIPREDHDISHTPPKAVPQVLALMGGDARQLAAAATLARAGYEIRLMGFSEAEDGDLHPASSHPLPTGVKISHRLDRALEGCHAILLPYPATKDGETVFCPLGAGTKLPLREIRQYGEKHPEVRVFGGRLPKAFTAPLQSVGCRVTDYEDSEAFLQRNARLTAEGAVMIAMEMTDTALLRMKTAVVGFGRIGQLLSRLLRLLGADVTVFARRQESLAEAESEGHFAISTQDIHRLCEGYGLIFNTVPARVVDAPLMMSLPCATKWIELASAPGGLDPTGVTEATKRCGLQVIRAPSLPGRYAPVDAGDAIAQLVLSVLEEVEP